jgi:hypothetical protein
VTTNEAAELLVDLTRQLARARAERDSWQMLARLAVHHCAALTRDLQMVDRRQYVYRRFPEEMGDVAARQNAEVA